MQEFLQIFCYPRWGNPLKFRKNQMSLRVVQRQGFAQIQMIKLAVQPAENAVECSSGDPVYKLLQLHGVSPFK